MTLPLRPRHGGFLRPFGCAIFVRDFLWGKGPHGSQVIDAGIGAPQSDICFAYKQALRRATAEDKAVRQEEKRARKEKRPINPDNIEANTRVILQRLPYKSRGCRYHSFVNYFSTIQKLGWVETSGVVETSAFQENSPQGKPRIFFRLTARGIAASDAEWADPKRTLYGR